MVNRYGTYHTIHIIPLYVNDPNPTSTLKIQNPHRIYYLKYEYGRRHKETMDLVGKFVQDLSIDKVRNLAEDA